MQHRHMQGTVSQFIFIFCRCFYKGILVSLFILLFLVNELGVELKQIKLATNIVAA